MELNAKNESVSKSVENNCSVEISISSKGLWSAKCKGYAVDLDTAMKNTLAKAEELSSIISEKNK